MKQQQIIGLFFVGLIAVIAISMLQNGAVKVQSPEKVLKKVRERYGEKIARWVEQIYRKETANFTSKQYLATYSAGMEAHADRYPYGWTTPAKLWKIKPEYRPVGVLKFRENQTGIMKPFLAFRNLEAAMMSLAAYLERYQNPGRWYSLDKEMQQRYINELATIRTQFV